MASSLFFFINEIEIFMGYDYAHMCVWAMSTYVYMCISSRIYSQTKLE